MAQRPVVVTAPPKRWKADEQTDAAFQAVRGKMLGLVITNVERIEDEYMGRRVNIELGASAGGEGRYLLSISLESTESRFCPNDIEYVSEMAIGLDLWGALPADDDENAHDPPNVECLVPIWVPGGLLGPHHRRLGARAESIRETLTVLRSACEEALREIDG